MQIFPFFHNLTLLFSEIVIFMINNNNNNNNNKIFIER